MSEIQEEYISCEEGAVKSTIITRVQTETRKKWKFWLLFATLSALFLGTLLVAHRLNGLEMESRMIYDKLSNEIYGASRNQTTTEKLTKLRLTHLETGTYYISSKKLQWADASDFCQEHGMEFAIFNSLREMKLFYYEAANGDFWVAGSDFGQVLGHYVWEDGTAVDESFFDTQQCGGAATRACTLLRDLSEKLCPDGCSRNHFFICKVRAQDVA